MRKYVCMNSRISALVYMKKLCKVDALKTVCLSCQAHILAFLSVVIYSHAHYYEECKRNGVHVCESKPFYPGIRRFIFISCSIHTVMHFLASRPVCPYLHAYLKHTHAHSRHICMQTHITKKNHRDLLYVHASIHSMHTQIEHNTRHSLHVHAWMDGGLQKQSTKKKTISYARQVCCFSPTRLQTHEHDTGIRICMRRHTLFQRKSCFWKTEDSTICGASCVFRSRPRAYAAYDGSRKCIGHHAHLIFGL
jgi:hypothetical protein